MDSSGSQLAGHGQGIFHITTPQEDLESNFKNRAIIILIKSDKIDNLVQSKYFLPSDVDASLKPNR